MVQPYRHEPFTDFSVEENKKEMEEALSQVKQELGQEYPLIIGGERIYTDSKIESANPAKKDEVVGYVSKADKELAEKAMQVADETFGWWRKSTPEMRADILFRAAAIVRRRKHEFSAWIIHEGGKPWKEADADIAEGIDFLEYYGRQMLEIAEGKEINSRPVENNRFSYIPLGVGLVVSPWNFLFAIMCGTAVSPMVTGNTVLLKPASATPVISYKLMEVLEEAGMPAGVINYIPGSGGEIGDYLVEHPKTRFVSFTGSREVGTGIYEKAAKVQPGQKWLKRVVAEMGGKDTIVVDNDCDLELAAESVMNSAFGFQGQKCSACSRVVAHEDVYDDLLDRVVELTKGIDVGNTTDNNHFMGPVIDQGAYDKIMGYIETGKNEGKLAHGGNGDNSKGYFIDPTIFADVDPEGTIMQEEIFGPVVAFTKAKDFDEAIDIANNTEYGLTGAVISNNRNHLEIAREDFHVGNLYFNRGCTAAIVGYHPFGGFNMSGTDSKAGGPDYLYNFMQGKTVSEML
ncbi:L-glutamate gamma-semialdehyde dehydrogenase [Tenuibacillus multivorans]|uniref:1-pyrroline-5-carboxylate dehydrogenase n=1 Tax=Tenuibacillus multivorans TaxID=237069 RepID=A0A1H0E1B6_9BACI|nr:L-glutamate gamma-semialdehyde dehydrogenase [Tenuibacillus multivorans]GEL76696.1 1-pyrroline-5-carboxylate dehydrogenase [Tenuibacillus multivorans]SDN76073.1 1-pyrroline-5-carboxylate dehydrogenase [Tenuibacillus multivorans]